MLASSNLVVRVGADASRFSQGMRQAQSSLGVFGVAVGTMLGGLAAKAATALGDMAMDAAKAGINFNAMAEQSKVAWTTLLGDGQKAQKMLDDINKFAANTPFTQMGVDDMAKQLKNAGFQGQQIFDKLTKMGDMGSAFGIQEDSLKEMTRQYAQVQQAQVAYTEDLNILQDRGIPIYKALSDVMKVPVKDIKKLASEGKITADVYNKAIDSIASNTKGAMAAQSKTFNGLMSTLKDNLTMIAGKITKGLFESMKKGLENVSTIIGNFMSMLDGKMSKVDFLKSLGLSDGSISLIVSALGMAQAILKGFFSYIQGAFNTYKQYVVGVFSGDGNVGNSFMSMFNTIKDIALPILNDAISFIKSILGQLSQFWSENGNQIIQAVKNMWSIIAGIFSFFAPVLQFIVTFVWDAIKGVIQGAVNIIIGIIKIFTGIFTLNFKTLWDGVKQLFVGAVQFIWNLMSLSFVRGILSGIKGFASSLGSSFSGMWTNAKGIFSSGVGAIKNGVSSGFSNIVSTAGSIFSGIKSVLTSPIESAKSVILGIIDSIKSAFSRFSINIPRPKLPHISWSMKNVAGIVDIPSFGVDWYANGGFFNKPSVIGIGEAGPEMALPLAGKRMRPFAETVAHLIGMDNKSKSVSPEAFTIVSPVIIDGREVARVTAKHMPKELEIINNRDARLGGG